MKLIAITQRVDKVPQYDENRDALDQRWWNLLNACDLIPVIFPNDLALAYKLLKTHPIDGIILSGGNQTRERIEVESLLIETAISHRIPLLGVCNGMQVIQNYFGISLIKTPNHIHSKQEILVEGEPDFVNSYHEEGTVETIDELVVWARAHDGIIKAIKHIKYPLTGIMWHPERIAPFANRDVKLIKKIFQRN